MEKAYEKAVQKLAGCEKEGQRLDEEVIHKEKRLGELECNERKAKELLGRLEVG